MRLTVNGASIDVHLRKRFILPLTLLGFEGFTLTTSSFSEKRFPHSARFGRKNIDAHDLAPFLKLLHIKNPII